MTQAVRAAKRLVRGAAHAVGLEVSRYRPADGRDYVITRVGVSALRDMHELLADVSTPIVFDVGANVGQSVAVFREALPDSILHAFEPGPEAFAELEANTRRLGNLQPSGRFRVHGFCSRTISPT